MKACIACMSPIDAAGMKRPKKMNLAASRLRPERNCGPTFMPTANMKRSKKIVLVISGISIFTPRTASTRLRARAMTSVEAVAPRPMPLIFTRPSA